MSAANCLVVAGPSGVGKSTLIRRVLEARPAWRFSVSATTRPQRDGEQEGVDYHFLSAEEFGRRVAAGAFMEYAEVYGHNYGTLWSELEGGGFVLIEVDTVGCLTIGAARPDIPRLGILPPSMAELQKRLQSRESESEESLRRRLAGVFLELTRMRSFDFAIVNDDIDRATQQLLDVMRVVEAGLTSATARVDGLLAEFKEASIEAT